MAGFAGYIFDVAELEDFVIDNLNDNVGVAWESVVQLIIENVFVNLVHGNRYRGERDLEDYMVKRGYRHYEAIISSRDIHTFALKVYFEQIPKGVRVCQCKYNSDLKYISLATDLDSRRGFSPTARPYPQELEELTGYDYIPERIRRLLEENRRAG